MERERILHILETMRIGEKLLKYGRVGKPKLFLMRINLKGTHLHWAQKDQELTDKNGVILSDVQQIVRGRGSKSDKSFSLVFKNSKSIDIECHSLSQCDEWILGLNFCVKQTKRDPDPEQCSVVEDELSVVNDDADELSFSVSDTNCEVVREGWLHKRGEDSLSFAAFRKRWFVLRSDYTLHYYDKDIRSYPSTHAKGVVMMSQVKNVYASSSRRRHHLIHLETEGRTYILSSQNATDQTAWIQKLNWAMEAKRESINLHSNERKEYDRSMSDSLNIPTLSRKNRGSRWRSFHAPASVPVHSSTRSTKPPNSVPSSPSLPSVSQPSFPGSSRRKKPNPNPMSNNTSSTLPSTNRRSLKLKPFIRAGKLILRARSLSPPPRKSHASRNSKTMPKAPPLRNSFINPKPSISSSTSIANAKQRKTRPEPPIREMSLLPESAPTPTPILLTMPDSPSSSVQRNPGKLKDRYGGINIRATKTWNGQMISAKRGSGIAAPAPRNASIVYEVPETPPVDAILDMNYQVEFMFKKGRASEPVVQNMTLEKWKVPNHRNRAISISYTEYLSEMDVGERGGSISHEPLWLETVDDEGEYYYCCPHVGITQFNTPPDDFRPLPPTDSPWIIRSDPEVVTQYYFNKETGATMFQPIPDWGSEHYQTHRTLQNGDSYEGKEHLSDDNEKNYRLEIQVRGLIEQLHRYGGLSELPEELQAQMDIIFEKQIFGTPEFHEWLIKNVRLLTDLIHDIRSMESKHNLTQRVVDLVCAHELKPLEVASLPPTQRLAQPSTSPESSQLLFNNVTKSYSKLTDALFQLGKSWQEVTRLDTIQQNLANLHHAFQDNLEYSSKQYNKLQLQRSRHSQVFSDLEARNYSTMSKYKTEQSRIRHELETLRVQKAEIEAEIARLSAEESHVNVQISEFEDQTADLIDSAQFDINSTLEDTKSKQTEVRCAQQLLSFANQSSNSLYDPSIPTMHETTQINFLSGFKEHLEGLLVIIKELKNHVSVCKESIQNLSKIGVSDEVKAGLHSEMEQDKSELTFITEEVDKIIDVCLKYIALGSPILGDFVSDISPEIKQIFPQLNKLTEQADAEEVGDGLANHINPQAPLPDVESEEKIIHQGELRVRKKGTYFGAPYTVILTDCAMKICNKNQGKFHRKPDVMPLSENMKWYQNSYGFVVEFDKQGISFRTSPVFSNIWIGKLHESVIGHKNRALLMAASCENHIEIWRLLAEDRSVEKAHPGCVDDNKNTALHIAVLNDDEASTQCFINGAPGYINTPGREGRTALHISAMNSNLPLIQLLVQNGADPFVEDEHQKSPSNYCSDDSVSDFLRKAMEERSRQDERFMGVPDALIVFPEPEPDVEMERNFVLKEIVSSELHYLGTLQTLGGSFKVPLGAILSQEHHKRIFANVNVLTKFHQMFYDELSKSDDTPEVFVKMGSFLNLYKDYADGYEGCLSSLEKLGSFAELQKFLRNSKKNIIHLLNAPFRRICRYKVLLGKLKHKTAPNSDEFPLIEAALKNVYQISEHVQHIEEKLKSKTVELSLLHELGLFLPPVRSLIMRGVLKLWSKDEMSPREVVLFSDVFIYQSEQQHKYYFRLMRHAKASSFSYGTDVGVIVSFNDSTDLKFICEDRLQQRKWIGNFEDEVLPDLESPDGQRDIPQSRPISDSVW